MKNSSTFISGFPGMRAYRFIWALLATCLALRAQVLDEAVFTLGTTARDGSGRDWAYVVVQPTQPSLLAERKLAVYLKAGDPDSGAAYERKAVLSLQTDPLAIKALLGRAANLGDNLADLSGRIDNLFAAVIPSPSLPLEEKISAAIRGSLSKPEHFLNLIQLGRLHPAIEMALGLAHAEMIPAGKSTFEVRDFDLAANADRGVLGRVTVQAGAPVVLPRTGTPFQVADASAKGHLNAKLRWSTSPEFRRLSLLSYGFNVYRIRKAFAELPANNFDDAPPTPAQLGTLLVTQPALVQVVNNLPILPGANLDETPAINANSVYNSSNTIAFVTDDNGLARGGSPFVNGDQFYYFAAGRDLLGRIGLVSTGALVTLCDRIPPDSPRLPIVENDYHFVSNVEQQRLKVTWQPVVPGPEESIIGYYVYRWRAPSEVNRNASNPSLNRASGFIPHVNGQTSYTFVDSGAGAPTLPADVDRTFWYTVRAVDGSACVGNLSANSPAAFGVLRDRTAPAGPVGGGPITQCCTPLVDNDKVVDTRLPDTQGATADPFVFNLTCERRDTGVAWADFWFSLSPNDNISEVATPLNYKGRVTFLPGQARATVRIEVAARLLQNNQGQTVVCRVGNSHEDTSGYAASFGSGATITRFASREFNFISLTRCREGRPRPPGTTVPRIIAQPGCDHHTPRPPGPVDGEPGPLVGPVVEVPLTPTTKEYRLYRRVDFGPLQLIKQGQANYDSVTNVAVLIPDNDLPASSAVICYYAQLFDQNGNGSPLTQLGDCIPVEIDTAKPLLAALEPKGTEAAPEMRIRWFCPPAGIQRFQVCVAAFGVEPPVTLSQELGTNTAPQLNIQPVVPGVTNLLLKDLFQDWGYYLTPMVGPNFGSGAAFEVTVPIQTGRKYWVKIRTVDASGAVMKTSNIESFLWTAVTVAGPQVPWPARPLPSLETFSTNLAGVRIKTNEFNGLGVVIGGGFYFGQRPVTVLDGTVGTVGGQRREVVFTGQVDPKLYVFTNSLGASLLPIALYRYQVPNPVFPKVSGDMVQVSPLMERIASVTTNSPAGTVTKVYDPFIYITPPVTITDNFGVYFMVLKDTQPAVVGATYKYVLVRFDASGEITEVIPVKNSVEATL
jgi:hypothetical protein